MRRVCAAGSLAAAVESVRLGSVGGLSRSGGEWVGVIGVCGAFRGGPGVENHVSLSDGGD